MVPRHQEAQGILDRCENRSLQGVAAMRTVLLRRAKRLGLLAATLLVLVQPAAGAEGNTRKVGVVAVVSVDAASRSPAFKRFADAVRASAPDLDISFELRSAEGKNDRYPQIVSELVQQQVDVIFAGPGAAALASKHVTTTVPVVFMIAANPVTLGLVESLEKPGGNITGLYEERADFGSKRIALLKDLVPRARTIGVLWDGSWPDAAGSEMAREAEKAILAAGARAVIVAVRGPDDLERAFSLLNQAQVDGLVVEQGPVFYFQAKKLADLAAGAKLAAVYPSSVYTQVGGLASFGPDLADNTQRMGGHVGKILKGANPAELAVEHTEKTQLIVNARAAKDLGIAIPPQLRARADSVIE
jgi:putative ABC transport system substrate-binding protein